MNIILKSAVVGALALGGSSAFALGIPSQGSSDLVLIVQNTTTSATYGLDTGISINSIFPTSGLVSGATLSTALAGINRTIDASSTLTSFLQANPASGDGWALEAGQFTSTTGVSSNGNTKAPGNAKAVFTSGGNPLNLGASGLGTLEDYENGIQGDFGNGGGLVPLINATESTAVTYSTSAASKYGFNGQVSDLGSLGTSIALYGFTGNGNTGQLQSYILGSADLSASGPNNGYQLVITGNAVSAVPLPPAVWLFGSGLLGLVGVSRRRKTAV